MVRARARMPFQDEAEQRFPYRVDLPQLPQGFGQRLNHMHDWCAANARAGWRQYGSHAKFFAGDVPHHYVRFCFMASGEAEAFRLQWGGIPIARSHFRRPRYGR